MSLSSVSYPIMRICSRWSIFPKEGEADIFELEQCGDKIVLRGNNGVSAASALNYYLKNYAHCEYSWNASNLKFPDPVPTVPEKVRKETPLSVSSLLQLLHLQLHLVVVGLGSLAV